MKRIVILSSLVTSAVWLALTALAMVVAFPLIADAQDSRIRAEQVTVVGTDGKELVRLGVPPAATNYACAQVLNVDGIVQTNMCTGGNGDPAAAGVNVFNRAGTSIARMGTLGPGQPTPAFFLRDNQARSRLIEQLDADGNASIQMLDADGNVVWSAP